MKLTVCTFLSLDGVMQGPGGPEEDESGGFSAGGWLVPFFDEAMGAFVGTGFETADALLLGRGTYDVFASHWPKVTVEQDAGAALMNALPRYVVGTPTLPVDWAGTTVLAGDPIEAIRALKAQPGRDLQVHGSPGLIQSLLAAGLVDELRLVIVPVLIGSGKRLFGEGTVPTSLQLVDSSVSPSGVFLAVYRPVGTIRQGSWALDAE